MLPIQEVYPDLDTSKEYFYGPGDYNPLLESIAEIILQVDDHGYQGDSRVLYKSDGKYGILIFGWGSCSGCDSLHGCRNIQEIEDLRASLVESIKWHASANELLKYMKNHDWEGDYSWHAKETRLFVESAINLLNEIIGLEDNSIGLRQ